MDHKDVKDRMEKAIKTRFTFGATRCPALKTMGKYIEEVLGYQTIIVEGHCNTDRKPRGSRIVTSPGKGRRGNRLVVWRSGPFKNSYLFRYGDQVVLDHDSAQTYRHNTEVAEWILGEEEKREST